MFPFGRRQLVPLTSLGITWHDQTELAVLLSEEGGLVIENRPYKPFAATSRSQTPRGRCVRTLAERVQAAEALDISPGKLDWSRLVMAVPSEALSQSDLLEQNQAVQLELNSGGKVFFCLFSPARSASDCHPSPFANTSPISNFMPTAVNRPNGLTSTYPILPRSARGRPIPTTTAPPQQQQPAKEGVVVLKFCGSRLLAQAEQLAGELARHCGVAAPESRVLHQSGSTAPEWEALETAAGLLVAGILPTDTHEAKANGNGPNSAPEVVGLECMSAASFESGAAGSAGGQELQEELRRVPAALLMSYVAGSKLAQSQPPSSKETACLRVVEDLGRLFVLDMVLGNADRLPCSDLGWRGNTGNLLLGGPGSKFAGHAVAIDACVQRRPPAAKLDWEDEAVDRTAQLVLSDPAGQVVLPLLRNQLLSPGPAWLQAIVSSPGSSRHAAAAFKKGMRWCLQRVVALKGLFEMVHARITEWVTEFIADVKKLEPNLQLPSPVRGSAYSSNKSGGSPTTSRACRSARSLRSPRESLALNVADDCLPIQSTPIARRMTSDGVVAHSAPPAQHHQAHAIKSPRGQHAQHTPGGPRDDPHVHLPPIRPRSRDMATRSSLPSAKAMLPVENMTRRSSISSPFSQHDGGELASPPFRNVYSSRPRPESARTSVVGRDNVHGFNDSACNDRYSNGNDRYSNGQERERVSVNGCKESHARESIGTTFLTAGALGDDGSQPSSPISPSPTNPLSPQSSGQDFVQPDTELPTQDEVQEPLPCYEGRHSVNGTPMHTPPYKRSNMPATEGVASRDNARALSLTRALNVVNQHSKHNEVLGKCVEKWQDVFRAHAAALKAAADEWQMRRGFDRVLTLGFLSGAKPTTDLYELKVRLDHMLRRMRVLEEAAAAVAPIRVLDDVPLYLGNAVAADAHHVLRHLGITHILNATEEVAAPPATAGFTVLRLPMRDTDDEDISQRFDAACDFIDMALKDGMQSQGLEGNPTCSETGSTTTPVSSAGGANGYNRSSAGNTPHAVSSGGGANPPSAPRGVLVHCSEGRSRSVALVAAYLVSRCGMRLAPALALIRSRRPEAAPNPGFSAALISLERDLYGSSSVEGATGATAKAAKDVLGAKRGKPEAARCPVCGIAVGLSTASLRVHLRFKHPDHELSQHEALQNL